MVQASAIRFSISLSDIRSSACWMSGARLTSCTMRCNRDIIDDTERSPYSPNLCSTYYYKKIVFQVPLSLPENRKLTANKLWESVAAC